MGLLARPLILNADNTSQVSARTADKRRMRFLLHRACLALVVVLATVALSGCWVDSYDEDYCRESPYAESCPLGQGDDGGNGTTTIEIYPVP